jgi:hypothetical protein
VPDRQSIITQIQEVSTNPLFPFLNHFTTHW